MTLCSLHSLEGAAPKKATATSSTLRSGQSISTQESQLLAAINRVRVQRGLSPLTPWNALTYFARQHSQNMADRKEKFGHGGFDSRANLIHKTAPCLSVGENVSYCYLIDDPLKKSVEMWMESPHHRDNILGDYTETGVGIAYDDTGRCYLTQMFSKRK